MASTRPIAALLAAGLLAGGTTAQAEELTIGLGSEPSSTDPHYHALAPNNQLARHIFESVTDMDAAGRLVPLLAESWTVVEPTVWEFKLRPDVRWSDGKPFTAQDVIYSVCRIPNVKDSPSSFAIYTKAIAGLEAPDPHTLRIRTDTPYPQMPADLSGWYVIQAPDDAQDMAFKRDGCDYAGQWPSTEDFNNGKLAIGTGPYKLEQFTKGDRVVLVRNADYWGDAPHWERVIRRPLTNAGARVAALLSGDVDAIDNPPIQDLPRLEGDANVEVVKGLSNRVIYLALNQTAEGAGLQVDGKNPLQDRRVREALSMAINRAAIVDRIMGGVAEPAAQLLPEQFFGSNPDLKPTAYDPDAAKQLLTEAGYPDGFALTLGTPNDRYINDAQVAQAVAQFWTRLGVRTDVSAATATVFFANRNKFAYPVYLAGWGASTNEMSSPLRSLVATRVPAEGMGTTNFSGYSNPQMDETLKKALATVDDNERNQLLQEASQLVIEDFGILPLHYEVTPWAMRKGLTYAPRVDQYTLAFEITPAS